jgi:cytochrome P450
MQIPTLPPRETAAVMGDVVVPLVARGVIVRRPRVENLLERGDGDARAIARVQRLAERHGPGPVRLAIPGRRVAFVLSPEDAQRVLDGSPEPFALANREKRSALSHFQPEGVLISRGPVRAERRRFNEEVLETGRERHRLADTMAAKVREEVAHLQGPRLDWDAFATAWWRLVRRVVLGDGAREDHGLTDMLARLRRDANWAFVKPKRRGLRAAFFERLDGHLRRAEPGSLAAVIAATPAGEQTQPLQQVPQWLFAFDAAGMATFRALALGDSVFESVRLWPTTPAILRDTTQDTEWASGTLPAGSALVIFVPYFNRCTDLAIPFSAGAGRCPGRELVLFLGQAWIEALRTHFDVRPVQALPSPPPATVSPFRLQFDVHPRAV